MTALFQPILPVIVDLYLHILHLNDIGEILDGYEMESIEVPSEFHSRLESSASLFANSEEKVLNILKSRYVVDRQLTIFHERRGEA